MSTVCGQSLRNMHKGVTKRSRLLAALRSHQKKFLILPLGREELVQIEEQQKVQAHRRQNLDATL